MTAGLFERVVLIIIQVISGLVSDIQRRARLRSDADRAAEQAVAGDPSEAEQFIRENGGPKP